MNKTVYVLTEEYNEYNQYGEYFIAAFMQKPTLEQLMKFDMNEIVAQHVLTGGGRIQYEHHWYNLREEVLF